MDTEKLGEIVGTSVATGTPVTPERLGSVFTVTELLSELEKRGFTAQPAGAIAVSEAVEPLAPAAATTETSDLPEQLPLSESLLEGFDTAYQTYGFLLDTANSARTEAKGRKKPAAIEAVDVADIRTEVEALLADEAIMAELQAEIDYFTANPEANSPAPGFDLVIIPEGLAAADEQAIAFGLQGKIPSNYKEPYIRPTAYNDKRTPEVTGKGYLIAFAPRHYNVPKGTAKSQENWVEGNNQRTSATQLQTATDAEAMAYINSLVDTKQLDSPDTCFHQTYFRRFDQAPHDDFVSFVFVYGVGELCLDWSVVHLDVSARALVVPKA